MLVMTACVMVRGTEGVRQEVGVYSATIFSISINFIITSIGLGA